MEMLIAHGFNKTPSYGGEKEARRWLEACLKRDSYQCGQVQEVLEKRKALQKSDPDGLAAYLKKHATYRPDEPF